MGLGVLSYQAPILRAVRHLRAARESSDQLHGHFRSLTDGAKELQPSPGRRGAFAYRILDTASSIMENGTSANRTYAVASSWGLTLPFVAIGRCSSACTSWATPSPWRC